jgi:predicted methyltransferase
MKTKTKTLMSLTHVEIRTWRRRNPGACVAAILLVLATVASFPAGAAQAPVQANLDAAINGAQRSPENVERDRYRHPLQTLEFFGIKPDMTVVEVLPGGGWYTEILAPFLHDHGRLIEATPPSTSSNPFARRMAEKYRKKLEADPKVYGRVELQAFENPDYIDLGPPHSADMILTFRNTHDLVYGNPHDEVTSAVLDEFFRSAYRTLEPGGVLGVVAHRADPDQPVGKTYRMGRLPEPYVMQAAKRAGFTLAASSAINANPQDKRDVPVWYLAPSLRSPEKDRAKYESIGESDRMTLKFVKQ